MSMQRASFRQAGFGQVPHEGVGGGFLEELLLAATAWQSRTPKPEAGI